MQRFFICLVIMLATVSTPLLAADSISVSELKREMRDGTAPIVIDVRDEEEYLAGHIPGAIQVPAKNIQHHLDMLQQYQREEIVLYCRSGRRASAAATDLENAGFRDVKLLEGHFPAWQAAP